MAERFKTSGYGKDSATRTSDWKKYWKEHDRIFRNKKKLTKRPKRNKMVPET